VKYKTNGYQAYSCRNPGVTSGANISGAAAREEVEDLPQD